MEYPHSQQPHKDFNGWYRCPGGNITGSSAIYSMYNGGSGVTDLLPITLQKGPGPIHPISDYLSIIGPHCLYGGKYCDGPMVAEPV